MRLKYASLLLLLIIVVGVGALVCFRPLSVVGPEGLDVRIEAFRIGDRLIKRTDSWVVDNFTRVILWDDKSIKLVKEKVGCRLVLCGSMATDDPEGWTVYERVRRKARRLIERKEVLLITSENNILVNALQRSSAVVIQKSIKEGFGLTVTEALWKEKPVVASNVGGIPAQIENGVNGFLANPYDIGGFADRIVQILTNPSLAREVGKRGREVVRKKFLITRLLLDYLELLNDIIK